MADRASAAITIGGIITASVFADLVKLIGETTLSSEWDGPPFDPVAFQAGAPLALHAHAVALGQFTALEAFCVDHDIPFARWSGACFGAFGAERVVFTGDGEPRSFTADEDDAVLLSRDTAHLLGSYEAVLGYFDEADFTVPPLEIRD